MAAPLPEYFALFGLAPRFGLDQEALTRAYRQVLAQVHPDRYVDAGPAERRAAMQLASHANEAYEVLRRPSTRAAYLCRSRGVALAQEGAAPLAPALLERQMDWNEQLEDARAARAGARLAELAAELAAERERVLARVAQELDLRADAAAAAVSTRELWFLEKLIEDIARARWALTESGQADN